MNILPRILNILIAVDLLAFQLITLGSAKRNETISAAAWNLEMDGKIQGVIFRPLIDALFYPMEKNHCYESWLVVKELYTQNSDVDK